MARPTRIHDVVARTENGDPITVGDRIIGALRAGNYVETAAAFAGVHKDTIYHWLREGARAIARTEGALAKGEDPPELTENERAWVEFSDAVAQAQAAAEVDDVARLASLARGGLTVETITEKRAVNDQGEEVVTERTIRTEETLPDAATLRWRLERRHPDRWGRQHVEVSGIDGAPIELSIAEKRDALAARLSARRERLLGSDDDPQAGEDSGEDSPEEEEPGGLG
jgi:hypothetical protein